MRRIWILIALIVVVVGAGIWTLWPRNRQALVLYSAVDYGPEVAKAFTEATGIKVKAIRLSTGALLARVSAEGKRPSWDMVWFDGDEAAAALDSAGLLAKNTVPSLEWNPQGKALLPQDGSYTPTGLTLAGAFTYRAGALANPPTSWQDLNNASLKGQVGMNNPAISGPMYPLLAGLLSQGGGWPAGKSLVLSLKQNGLHVYPKNANTLAAMRSGDIKVAVTQSSAAWYMASNHPDLKVTIPKPSFALPSVLAVAQGVSPKVRAEAEKFIRFAMAPDTQKLRMTKGEADGYYWPLTEGAPAPMSVLPALSSIAVKHLDPAQWGPIESQVNHWFSEAVVGQ